MKYRPEIDGLRAIAVCSIILYHAQFISFGRDWFNGGYVGVDIFFVISGYLITLIILTELKQTNKFNFIRFYERRARRIFPMLLLIIAVSIIFAWHKLIPLDLVKFSKSALSSIFFGSNFFFYYSTVEYGSESSLLFPLLHTWSLSVEEQFYVIFPIITVLIFKFSRKSLITLFIAMLLFSIQFADLMNSRNSQLNFFLPFSRFWELLVGSVLAFLEVKYGRFRNSLTKNIFPIIGLFLIFHSIFFFNTSTPHPSFQTLIPIIGVTFIIAFCSKDDPVGKLLSFKPFVGIGLISYSLYLWHYPIFAFKRTSNFNLSNFEKFELVTLTLLLSIMSYFLIERPFRNNNIVKRKLFFTILIVTISVLGYVNYNLISNKGYKIRMPQELANITFDEKRWEIFKQNGIPCYNRKKNFCSVENNIDLTRVYSFGDSHLASISPELVTMLPKKFNYTEVNFMGCLFVFNVTRYTSNTNKPHECGTKFNQMRYKLIEEKPSIILVGGRFPHALSGTGFDNKEGGIENEVIVTYKSSNNHSFKKNFINTINKLIIDGHQVILIYPIPEVGVNVPKFFYNKTLDASNMKGIEDINRVMNTNPLSTSYDVYLKRTASTFELFDSIKSMNIHRVYPHNAFCNKHIKNRCLANYKGKIYYADDDHLSHEGSKLVVQLILEKIEKADKNIRNSQRILN